MNFHLAKKFPTKSALFISISKLVCSFIQQCLLNSSYVPDVFLTVSTNCGVILTSYCFLSLRICLGLVTDPTDVAPSIPPLPLRLSCPSLELFYGIHEVCWETLILVSRFCTWGLIDSRNKALFQQLGCTVGQETCHVLEETFGAVHFSCIALSISSWTFDSRRTNGA